jgi:hypothetical protein
VIKSFLLRGSRGKSEGNGSQFPRSSRGRNPEAKKWQCKRDIFFNFIYNEKNLYYCTSSAVVKVKTAMYVL